MALHAGNTKPTAFTHTRLTCNVLSTNKISQEHKQRWNCLCQDVSKTSHFRWAFFGLLCLFLSFFFFFRWVLTVNLNKGWILQCSCEERGPWKPGKPIPVLSFSVETWAGSGGRAAKAELRMAAVQRLTAPWTSGPQCSAFISALPWPSPSARTHVPRERPSSLLFKTRGN